MAQTLIIDHTADLVCRMPEFTPLDLMTETPNLPANGNDTIITPAPVIPIGTNGPGPASTARQFGDVAEFTSDVVSAFPERAVSYHLEAPLWAKYQLPHRQAQIMEAYQDAMAQLHEQPWFQALDEQGQEKARAILINDVNFDSSFLGRMETAPDGVMRFRFMSRQLDSIREREQVSRNTLSAAEFVWRQDMARGMVNHFGLSEVEARAFVDQNRDAIASLWPVWQELPSEALAAHEGGFPEFVFRQQVEVRRRQAVMAEARDPRRREKERMEERRGIEAFEPARGWGMR